MKKEQKHIDETILLKIVEHRATDSEKSLFNIWINWSKENASYFDDFKKTYELLDISENSLKKNWDSIKQKFEENKTVEDYIELPQTKIRLVDFSRNTIFRIAASLVIILGVSFLLKTLVFDSKQLIVSGNNLDVNEAYQMADGSLVYLNKNSELRISREFGSKNRNVTLKGEAFFKVARNEQLPFRIETYNTTVEVLGTSFNIYSDKTEQVEVSVVTGLVEFYLSNKDDKIKLQPGEQGFYKTGSNDVSKRILKDQNFMAWKTGILEFHETPLQEAFHIIEKHYSRVLIFDSIENEFPSITTRFDNQPFEAVLDELNLLLNAKHETSNDTIIFKPNSW